MTRATKERLLLVNAVLLLVSITVPGMPHWLQYVFAAGALIGAVAPQRQ